MDAVTGEGLAAAGVAIAGAALGTATETLAFPLTPPLAAVTVKGPPALVPAV